jgi:hypothetical protein
VAAELAPVGLGDIDAEMLRRGEDVGEREVAVARVNAVVTA